MIRFLNYIYKCFHYSIQSVLNCRYRNYDNKVSYVFLELKRCDNFDNDYIFKNQGLEIEPILSKFSFITDKVSNKTIKSFIPSKIIRFKQIKNFDIKFIWDLNRFQFLDSFFYHNKGSLNQKKYFLNLITKFMKYNKPYLGPNWICTMDVAIRAVNVAYYMDYKSKELNLDNNDLNILSNFFITHLFFIRDNLEWTPTNRGNHYLSNITALIILSLKFEKRDAKISNILKFSIVDFFKEINNQFNADGTYYENSTAYHRLALEMVFYTVIYIESTNHSIKEQILAFLHEEKLFLNYNSLNLLFQDKMYPLLYKGAMFCKNITRKKGEFSQIGDNDSGRFIVRDSVWLNDFKENFGSLEIDKSNFTIVKDIKFFLEKKKYKVSFDKNIDHIYCSNFNASKLVKYNEYRLVIDLPLKDLRQYIYKDFGLVIWKNDTFYISFRCGNKVGKFVHAHEDQLSIEVIDGDNVYIQDKGSYTYTRDYAMRDNMRSVKSHWVPCFEDISQAKMNSVFNFEYNGEFNIQYVNKDCVFGTWEVEDRMIGRKIVLSESEVLVYDYVSHNSINLVQLEDINTVNKRPFSPEYGVLNL